MTKIKLTAIVLSATIILSALSGCSKKDISTDKETGSNNVVITGGAKGRYVETEVKLPENLRPILMNENEDGSLSCYGNNDNDNDNDSAKGFEAYTTKDFKTWTKEPTPWIESIIKSETGYTAISNFIKTKDGFLLSIYDKSNLCRIYKVVGETATEVPLPSWDLPLAEVVDFDQASNGSAVMGGVVMGGAEESDGDNAPTFRQSIYISSLTALENGDFMVGLPDNTIRYNGTTGAEVQKYGSSYQSTTIQGNKLYRITDDQDSIDVIDLGSGGVDKNIPITKSNGMLKLFSGEDGSLYLAGKFGISRMVAGGSVWENVADGALSALSIPSLFLLDITVDKEQNFNMIFSKQSLKNCLFYRSVYDKNSPTVPNTELTVYSLYENDTVRQAIGEFQQTNPNIMVNYKIGMDSNSSATVSDVIRSLNIEIVANKAPDVLILDGLPANSYIQKGVFTDLTDFYSEINSTNKLVEPIGSSFKKDGKLFAIPARFKMPVIVGSEETLSKLNSLEDFAMNNSSNTPLLSALSISDFLDAFIPSSYEAWTKEDGSLDKVKLAEFLTGVKTAYDKYKPLETDNDAGQMMTSMAITSASGGGAVSFTADDMRYMSRDVMVNVKDAASSEYIQMMFESNFRMNSANGEKDNNKVAPSTVKLTPGQSKGSFTPTVVAGITVNSKQQDIAKNFLKTLLSDSVQTLSFGDGFSVNEKAFDESNVIIQRSDDGEQITKKKIDEVKALLNQLTTPVMIDNVVLSAVKDNATSLLEDKKDVETAINDITEKIEIYLAE